MGRDIQIFFAVQIGGYKHQVRRTIPWEEFNAMRYPKDFIHIAMDSVNEDLKKEVDTNKYL